MPDYADVAPDVLARLGDICLALPEVWTEPAWTGHRFLIRKRNFMHVFALHNQHDGIDTMLSFRSPDEERDVLIASGHPFYRPGWGINTIGMVLDADVDWEEIEELATESYCLLAPKKLTAQIDRPDLVE